MIIDAKLNKFKTKVGVVPWQPYSILTSEAYAICTMFDEYHCDAIIESGIALGRSAEIFARYFDDKSIISIDTASAYGDTVFRYAKERLSIYDNLIVIKGDSNVLMPKYIRKYSNRRLGVFIDGPKGLKAINLAKKIIDYDNVVIVGIHDMNAKKEYRNEMDLWERTFFYTDDKKFRSKYRNLDRYDFSWYFDGKIKLKVNDDIDGAVVGFAK